MARLLGGGDQRRGARRVAQRPRLDEFSDPGRASPLERTGIELLDLAQQRKDQIALAELEGERGRSQQPFRPWPGRAQLRGPLERGDCDRQRAAPPRAPGGLLQLVGDLFMGTADQRRAMPDAPVRLCPQYLGKRLVHAAALQQARALAHRRPDQRVAEAQAVEVEIDDRGLGGRLEQLKPQRCPGHHAGRVDDIAEALVVAVRGDQRAAGSRPADRLRGPRKPARAAG